MLAILDPFSGIAGDMFIGALIDAGLDQRFIEELPESLGLDGVGVRIQRVKRCGIAAVKVDFDIPPQPHGRHLKQLIEIVDRCRAPDVVKQRAAAAFRLIASVEADVHGTTVDRVHLHEVGAVDAILDVVGALWGLEKLGVTEVRTNVISMGDGFVKTEHGIMPVPAPATARILEGLRVRGGPPDSGELTTPTGAALVRVLTTGVDPGVYVPRRVGHGAGTKEFGDRANVLRIVIAEATDSQSREELVMLTADVDDMSPELVAAAAEDVRRAGALDVVLSSVTMKKGRLGTRFEALVSPLDAAHIEDVILMKTSSIGVRRSSIFRRALPRELFTVSVLGNEVGMKAVRLPSGEARVKPEHDDVQRVAAATGMSAMRVTELALDAARGRTGSV